MGSVLPLAKDSYDFDIFVELQSLKIKLTFSLVGMHISRDEDLPAFIEMGDKAQFVLWNREVENQGQTKQILHCDLIVEREPPKRAKATLLALLDHKILLDDPVQEGLPYDSGFGLVIDSSGNFTPKWIVPFDLLPKDAKPWFKQTYSEMSGQIAGFIKQARWLQNASGGHRPFSMVGIKWSVDGELWSNFPFELDVRFAGSRSVVVSGQSHESLINFISSGFTEPVAHDLMREANDLASRTPRSALLIAFSALETGIKTQLVHLMPVAKTLIKNVPSPPIVTLLDEVIPEALKRNGIIVKHLPLTKPAKDYLKKWVSQRNHVTHGVKQSVDPEGVKNFIQFATDILYIFDYCNGHDWALDHLQSEEWRIEAP